MTDLPKFNELGLSEEMLSSLTAKGFERPTPIQARTIPFLLENAKDLIGKAQTGTGKTAAFGIPIIERLIPNSKKVQAIILAPTRELAIQVSEELASFADNKKVRIVAIYGGQPIDRQVTQLKRGVDIVVGTPGRVMDHMDRGTLDISAVSYVVLDEADEMLNMGFVEDIETILKSAPKNRRTVLFSATMPSHIERLAKKYMSEYEVIEATKKENSRENIKQIYYEVAGSDKFEALYRIIDNEDAFYGMVFCRTKMDADDVSHKLNNRGCKAEAIHGDLSQAQREKVLGKFRKKQVTVLVATDVAARGIDVEDLTHVVNYSLPQDPESYVHRIGRTGRAGKQGIAIALITPSEFRKLIAIQRVSNAQIEKGLIPNVAQVIERKKQRVKAKISEIVATKNFSDLEEISKEILAENSNAQIVISALLKMAFKDELNEANYQEISEVSNRKKIGDRNFGDRNNRFERGDRFERSERSSFGKDRDRRGGDRDFSTRSGSTRLFIAKGRNDNMDPRGLVDLIRNTSGVDSRRIDDVKILDAFSFFAVPAADAQRVISSFQSGKRSLVSVAKEREKR